MFKKINNISDIQPAVAHKKEIKFFRQPNGIMLGCYLFMDRDTFDVPEALECRGICFGPSGTVVSRPLHKFFNVGEKEWLMPEQVMARDDIAAIFEKLDGSMLATAWIDGKLVWRSKQSFASEVVKLTNAFLAEPENAGIANFATEVARQGMTAIFELTHPGARIIVAPDRPRLRLLHVRDNTSGAYVMLDAAHDIHKLIERFEIPLVKRFEELTVKDLLSSLETMQEREGYVIQFANGDMAKVKCPWYTRLHSAVSFLRERDIARLALEQNLDDVKGALSELGIDLCEVNKVETRLKNALTALLDEIDGVYQAGKDLDRKTFAIQNKAHPLFGLIMLRYTGKEIDIADWYGRNRLKEEFGLRTLANDALAEAMDG
ncbi:MAG: RNA ligase [Alphaproteobacteria bacterium]